MVEIKIKLENSQYYKKDTIAVSLYEDGKEFNTLLLSVDDKRIDRKIEKHVKKLYYLYYLTKINIKI